MCVLNCKKIEIFRIRQRHLELEPLCCLSSCLVRGGCYAIVVFELIYILITYIIIAYKIYDGGRLKFWEDFEWNFNAFITHHFFLYVLVLFNLVSRVESTRVESKIVFVDFSCIRIDSDTRPDGLPTKVRQVALALRFYRIRLQFRRIDHLFVRNKFGRSRNVDLRQHRAGIIVVRV